MKAKDILKENKIKVTKNREEILDLLIKIESPISIKEIKEKVTTPMDLTTIYRTLDKLVAKNIIYKTNFGDAESYFEYQRNHHHHIICSSCGEREKVEFCLGKNFKEIEKELKKFNKVNSHMMELFGTCKVCSKS